MTFVFGDVGFLVDNDGEIDGEYDGAPVEFDGARVGVYDIGKRVGLPGTTG